MPAASCCKLSGVLDCGKWICLACSKEPIFTLHMIIWFTSSPYLIVNKSELKFAVLCITYTYLLLQNYCYRAKSHYQYYSSQKKIDFPYILFHHVEKCFKLKLLNLSDICILYPLSVFVQWTAVEKCDKIKFVLDVMSVLLVTSMH
jgi:hypothetical protein